MKLLKKDFLHLVLDEANHLREHATDEEKSRLSFNTLHVNSNTLCIYGQMTGNCFGARSRELFTRTIYSIGDECSDDFNKGCTTYEEWLTKEELSGDEETVGFSPIEAYITLKGSKNKQLIKFIKGEINTFKP